MPPAMPMIRAVPGALMPMLSAQSGRITVRLARIAPTRAAPVPRRASTPRWLQMV